MRDVSLNMIELITGALLMGLGLIFLVAEHKAMEALTDITIDGITEDKEMYQQYSNLHIDQISDEELYATIMGYREYPILIDGKLLPIHYNDYELYFSYISDGIYEKSYVYDNHRNIIQIVYTYIGVS